MNVKKHGNYVCAVALVALWGMTAPAWGQRIRFSESAGEEKLEPEPEPQARMASQAPIKPKVVAAEDLRPAPPPARAGKSAPPPPSEKVKIPAVEEKEEAPQIEAIPPLARRVPLGEPIETPPPYFVEPDPNLPLYEYEPYGEEFAPYGMEYGTDCAPGFACERPSFGLPGLPCVCRFPDLSWLRGVGVFGEYLYLHPRDSEIALAVPGQGPVIVGGNPAAAVPQGGLVLLDPDYSQGYRAGVFLPLEECSTLQLTYTMYESDTVNSRELTADEQLANIVLFPLLMHPLTMLPNNETNVRADGRLDIDLEMIDADTRLLLWGNGRFSVTGFAGARWADLTQDLVANYTINLGTVVQASTSFEGIGPRLGLDGYGTVGCWGFGYYARSEMNFLFGAVKGDYRQFQVNNPDNPQIFTDWKVSRIAPVYELELGVQWMGPRKRLRLSAGYLMSVWFNIIKPEDVVDGVQQNQFDDLSDSMTFDGLTARVEFKL
jgi:hypothetical protein